MAAGRARFVGRTAMQLIVNGQPKEFKLSPDALIYQRIGDEHLA